MGSRSGLKPELNDASARRGQKGQTPESFLTNPKRYSGVWRVSSKPVASAPPKFSAQLFSVGRFHLCFPHDTRGSRTFCVCDRGPMAWQEHPRLPSVPPSLLSKSALTSSPWHTHMAFCDHDLRACHCHSLSGGLGAAIHHANTAAAQGMEYKPARCCVTTSAP